MGLWETTARFNSAAISILEGWPTINILTIPLPPSLQRYDISIESGRACFTFFFSSSSSSNVSNLVAIYHIDK